MELTYVGPESVGPHYTESGKRPAEDKARVIIQREDGTRAPGTWFAEEQGFYAEGGWTVPVCWWHLPAAAPSTEREWFVANERRLGYVHGASPRGNPCRFIGHNPSCWTSKFVNTKEEATTLAYQHWVEAGQP